MIPILKNAGHRVIAVQLAAHSADDVKVNKDFDGGDDISD